MLQQKKRATPNGQEEKKERHSFYSNHFQTKWLSLLALGFSVDLLSFSQSLSQLLFFSANHPPSLVNKQHRGGPALIGLEKGGKREEDPMCRTEGFAQIHTRN